MVALISKLLKPPPPHPEEHPRNAWRQYHARYALLVLAFVVFDMEMEFMYPWAVAFRSQGIVGFGDMLVFVVILGVALTYMWRTGVLDFERRMNEALVLLGVAVVAIWSVETIDAIAAGSGVRAFLAPATVVRKHLVSPTPDTSLGSLAGWSVRR